MKLSTKLKISFAVLILVPVIFCCIGFIVVANYKMHALNNHGNGYELGYEALLNPIQLVETACKDQLEELHQVNASEFLNRSYTEKMNKKLVVKGAFLLVTVDGDCVYSGEERGEEIAAALDALEFRGPNDTAIYLPNYQIVAKRLDFTPGENEVGRAYVVMEIGGVIPQIRRLLVDAIGAVLLALILTSAIFTLWIYRAIVCPIDKLRLATENIRQGNLDFDMDTSGKDEFSDLNRDFDAMRIQLKTNQEEKLKADSESRELISNISHDLKTPITSIKGYVEGLLDGVANTPEKQDKYVRIIYNKACELDTLINELTFYSKIDNGKVPYNFAKISVSEYFSDCVEEIGMDLENKGFALGYSNEVSPETIIIADPEQLRRVIHNIVNNSVKYIQKDPGRISIHLKEDEENVYIALSDNGVGIEPDALPYIFDRFYRSDSSRNSKKGGSGIGLSIVKRILEDHDGSITCESVVNEGTTMHITLPKYYPKETASGDIDRD